MMCVIKNDKSVKMTVFDLQDSAHAVFQFYTSGSAADQYEYEIVLHDFKQKKN